MNRWMMPMVAMLVAAPGWAQVDAQGGAPSQLEAAIDVADAQALALLAAVHEHEVAAAALMAGRQVSPGVRRHAERASKLHAAALSRVRDVSAQSGISPQDTPDVVAFGNAARIERERFGSLELAEFERAYVEGTAINASALVQRIDRELLPRASNPAVTAHLRQIRGELEAFAAEAQALVATLGSS